METGEFAAKSTEAAAPAKEKKGGKGAVIGMIFFALVAVGLGVWVAILLLNPTKCNDIKNSGSSDNTATNCLPSEVTTPDAPSQETPSQGQASSNIKNSYVVSNKVSNLYLAKDGSVYVETFSWKNESLGGPYKLTTSSNAGTSGSYTIQNADLGNFSTTGTSSSITVNGMKLNVENVASIFAVEFGQNWAGDDYALVKTDGSVEIVSLHVASGSSDTLDVAVNKIDGVSGVVATVNTNTGEAYGVSVVKKDGSVVSIDSQLSTLADKLAK